MVYSTCSAEIEENEGIVNYAMEKFGFKLEPFSTSLFDLEEPIQKHCYRVFPDRNEGEIFFAARLRKPLNAKELGESSQKDEKEENKEEQKNEWQKKVEENISVGAEMES